jgi:hypothetical protein
MFTINKHKLNIFSIILFELRYIFFIIVKFSIKPTHDHTSHPRVPHLGRDLRLATTVLGSCGDGTSFQATTLSIS